MKFNSSRLELCSQRTRRTACVHLLDSPSDDCHVAVRRSGTAGDGDTYVDQLRTSEDGNQDLSPDDSVQPAERYDGTDWRIAEPERRIFDVV